MIETFFIVPPDKLSDLLRKALTPRSGGEKADMLPHNKLFAALFAWLAK
jgi:hypothetical protein